MTAPTGPRSLPISLEDERATLGSVLLNRDAIVPVADLLTPADFYDEAHGLIWAAMLHAYRQRRPPDLRVVSEALRAGGRLDAVGGLAYLASLTDGVPTAHHVEYYAQTVRRLSGLRQLISIGGQIAALGYERQDAELAETLGAALALLDAVATQHGGRAARAMEDLIGEYLDSLDSDAPAGGMPTGLHDLDALTGGLHRGQLTVLAARPGVGKSLMALNLADRLTGHGLVYLASLEMADRELAQRYIAAQTRIAGDVLRDRHLSTEQAVAVIDLAGRVMRERPQRLFVDDATDQTVASIRARALQLQAHSDARLALIVVDYLQLLRSSDRYRGNRTLELGELTRGFKLLAGELDVAVLLLCQLSRAVEGRASHVPMLSDLRESGHIEEDANNVWLLYREELYDKETDKRGILELHIAKQRNGPLGVVPFRYDGATSRIEDLTYRTFDGY